jgi:hypothetical protein
MRPGTPLLTLWLAAAAAAGPAAADSGLAGALVRDSQLDLHLRSHYLARHKSWTSDSLAWAAGGWLGYRSGWLDERLQLGLTGYGSQKLYAPADRDGTALLEPGQRSYGVLGEAWGALRLGGPTLTVGRFLVSQFEVNPQDTRMTPRTFEGGHLAGRAGGVDYYLGRLDKMRTRNADRFIDMAAAAGAPGGVREPMWLLSLRGAPRDDLRLGLAAYQVADVLASGYAEAAWTLPDLAGTRLRLGGQGFHQTSIGADLLTGAPFETWTLGLRADLGRGPLTLSGIVMATGDGAAYRTPYGSWPGYASRIINNFNRAGERVRALDAALDFAALGVPGLALNASASFGDHAVDAATGTALSDNAEYNLTLDYRLAAGAWPRWVRPLHLRARLARFEQDLGDSTRVTSEGHLIVNYEVPLK